MASMYQVYELIGTSPESWEKAAATVIARASCTLEDLRIAEVEELDLQIGDGQVVNYRVKLKVSCRIHERYEEREPDAFNATRDEA